MPGSIAFLADGRRAVVIGISRQLVGERAFGTHGFRYCGSLLASGHRLFDRGDEVAGIARALAAAVTEEFGLVGLNGLDFVVRTGIPYPIEVNPRYSASMELVERSTGASIFGMHEQACAGTLSEEPHAPRAVFGKAVVFGRRAMTISEPGLRADFAIADVPHPGERIGRGRPICTVFAEGRDADECRKRLVREAERVYRAVEPRVRGAA